MTARDRLALAAALAVALASSALGPMYDGYGWLVPTLGTVLAVAATGLVARRLRLPAVLVPVVQLAVLAAVVVVRYAGDTLRWVVVPTGRTRDVLLALAVEAAEDVEQLAAPVPARPALVALAVVGVGAIAVVVDLLAAGLQRTAVAGLPLLVLLAVPSGVLPGGLGWLPFTLGAAGWLGLLLVDGRDRVDRWGLALRGGGREEEASTGRVGRRIGVAALGVAAVVPALVPGLDARLLPGTGSGDGSGGTTVTYNPITRLQGELNRPEPVEVLRYRTDDPAPDYLRMTTLDQFDGTAWRSSALEGDPVDDGVPVAVGTSASRRRPVTVQVTLDDHLRSQWLPVPVVPTQVRADGDWRWDRVSETVYATRTSTRRLDGYTVRADRVLPAPDVLRAADEVPLDVERYRQPIDVEPGVAALTQDLAGGLGDPYDQAVALQRFFRDGRNGFQYDTRTEPLRDRDALAAFLLEDRRGYCEQYASAMAAMLRVLGIPARVGVGFTPGRLEPDGTRVVTTDDAHAWPEAWFEGAGWVRFEPTPTDDSRDIVPDYTLEQAAAASDEAGAQTPGDAAVPESSAAPVAPLDPQLADDDLPAVVDPLAAQEPQSALPSRAALLTALGVGLAAVPALAGAARRRSRTRLGDADAAWQQVRDDAEDVGHRWLPGDSPGAAAARLAQARSLTGAPREALERVAVATARARYARPGGPPPQGLRADVRTVRRGLLSASARGARLRALLLPPSTLRWMAGRAGSAVADLLDRADDGLAALGRRVRGRRRDAAA